MSLHLIHSGSPVLHLLHLHDDRLENRSGHEGGVLLPLLPPCPVLMIINVLIALGQKEKFIFHLVVCNAADQHVVVLPVAIDALQK